MTKLFLAFSVTAFSLGTGLLASEANDLDRSKLTFGPRLLDTPVVLRTFKIPESRPTIISAACPDRNGNIAFSTSDRDWGEKTISEWDPRTGEIRISEKLDEFGKYYRSYIHLSIDGNYFVQTFRHVETDGKRGALFIRRRNGDIIFRANEVMNFEYASLNSGKRFLPLVGLYRANETKRLAVFDTKQGKLLYDSEIPSINENGISVSSDGNLTAIHDLIEHILLVKNRKTGKTNVWELPRPDEFQHKVEALDFVGNTDVVLYLSSIQGVLFKLPPDQKVPAPIFTVFDPLNFRTANPFLSSDTRYMATQVTRGGDPHSAGGEVTILDAMSGKSLTKLIPNGGSYVHSVRFCPDHKSVLFVSANQVSQWQIVPNNP